RNGSCDLQYLPVTCCPTDVHVLDRKLRGGLVTEQYPTIEDNPKAALQSFIQELEEFYYPWYDKATTRNYYTWFAAQAVALLSGFATALLAALLKEDTFRAWGTGRVLLIVLPLLGTLGSTLLVQTRIVELEALRERGREN